MGKNVPKSFQENEVLLLKVVKTHLIGGLNNPLPRIDKVEGPTTLSLRWSKCNSTIIYLGLNE